MSEPVPLVQRREIEAKVVAPLIRAFAAEVGEPRARQILADVIRGLAEQAGCDAAAALGGNDLPQLKQVVAGWRANGALELTVVRDDADRFDFDVTRCRYAELYHALGLADLGPLLSCDRDAGMIAGFNPGIAFTRTQTIMGGASHCDFRYRRRVPG
jgi:hypothetical protein